MNNIESILTQKTSDPSLGSFEIKWDQWDGIDFSKTCFICPGQGSISPGLMKDEYLGSKTIQNYFKIADSFCLEKKISPASNYILQPSLVPEDEVELIKCLSLLTITVGLAEHLKTQGVFPDSVTSHSFGEYSALVITNIITFEEALNIVFQREALSPEPYSLGHMIALSTSFEDWQKLKPPSPCYLANRNGFRQMVISVKKDDLESVRKFLKEKRVAHKVLQHVPQPYHSELMEGARNKLKLTYQKLNLVPNKAAVPLFSSVTQDFLKLNSQDDLIDVLTQQLTRPVHFTKQIQGIKESGISHFIELSLLGVSAIFVKDILQKESHKITPIPQFFSQNSKVSAHKNKSIVDNKFVNIINNTVAKITGYKLDDISVTDKFQEDLGIDSIKKAEIIFQILNDNGVDKDTFEQMNINLSEITQLQDVANYLIAPKETSLKNTKIAQKPHSFFETYLSEEPLIDCSNKNFISKDLPSCSFNYKSLAKEGFSSLIQVFREANNDQYCFVDLRGYTCSIEESHKQIESLLYKLHECMTQNGFHSTLRLAWVVDKKTAPLLKSFSTFFHCLSLENESFFFREIHLNDKAPLENSIERLKVEFQQANPQVVHISENKRFIERFRPTTQDLKKHFQFSDSSCMVIIGGNSGIGRLITQEVSKKFNPYIYILGRASENSQSIKELLQTTSQKVKYISCDACDYQALKSEFLKIIDKHSAVDLAVNLAGVNKNLAFHEKKYNELMSEVNTKFESTYNLLELAKEQPIQKVNVVSSTTALYGNPGQAGYSLGNKLANDLVDDFANKYPDKYASSIAWDAWRDTGLVNDVSIISLFKDRKLITYIDPEKALDLFIEEASSSHKGTLYTFNDDTWRNKKLLTLNSKHKYIDFLFPQIDPGDEVNPVAIDINKHDYLRSHKIKGKVVFPGSGFVAVAAYRWFIAHGQMPVLKNIKFKNLLTFADKDVAELQIKEVDKGHSSQNISFKSLIDHFEADLFTNEAHKLPKDFSYLDGKRNFSAHYTADASEPYRNSPHINLDKCMQMFNEFLMDKEQDNFVARIELGNQPNLTKQPIYDGVLQITEAAFQTLGFAALFKVGKNCIPTSIETTYISEEAFNSDYIELYYYDFERSDNKILGSVLGFDQNKKPVVHLTNVKYHIIGDTPEANLPKTPIT